MQKQKRAKGLMISYNSNFLLKIGLFLILIIYSGLAYSQTTKIPTLQKEDIEVIKEAYNLLKTKGDKVWKGWSDINIPFIYKKNNYQYWINFPIHKVEGKFIGKIGNMDIYGTYNKSDSVISAASMDRNGIQAVVLSSPEQSEMTKEEWIITAIHEMFHVFQFQQDKILQEKIHSLGISYGKDASWMLDYPFPYSDKSLQTISHMEGYLLFKINKYDSLRETMYDCFLLKDVLSLYKKYINTIYGSEGNYKYSVFQQSIEGVAKYTEIKMAKIAATDYIPLSPNIHFTDTYTNQIYVIKHCGKGTSGRLTFYYLGLGECLVLDKINPNWKNIYFDTFWLDDIFNISLKQLINKQETYK